MEVLTMFGWFGGGGDGDAYNEQASWFDDEPDDGDMSQAFDALEGAGIETDEAADYLDQLLTVGASIGEIEEVVDGVLSHVDDGEFPPSVGDGTAEYTEDDYDDYTEVF